MVAVQPDGSPPHSSVAGTENNVENPRNNNRTVREDGEHAADEGGLAEGESGTKKVGWVQKQVQDNKIQKTVKNLFVLRILCMFTIFVISLILWNGMVGNSGDFLDQVVNSRFQGGQVLFLVFIMATMIVDRCIYTRNKMSPLKDPHGDTGTDSV